MWDFQSGDIGSLYTGSGQRKYLTGSERERFIAASHACSCRQDAAFGLMLAHTGVRISEALALIEGLVQRDGGFIAVRSLKKRGKIHFREIPAPPELFAAIDAMPHRGDAHARLWRFGRTRAWELIKGLMAQADIAPGIHATPKGLRHGYGLHAIRSGIPVTLLQRWMGHARLETTSIYLQAIGDEERAFAARMWGESSASCRSTSPFV